MVHRVDGNKRSSVQIEIRGDSFFIEVCEEGKVVDGSSISIPLSKVTLKRGGNRDSLLFIESAALNQSICYVECNQKNCEYLGQNKGLEEQIKILSSARSGGAFLVSFLVIVITALFGALIVYRADVFGAAANLVPYKWERSLGNRVFNPNINLEQKSVVEKLGSMFSPLQFYKNENGKGDWKSWSSDSFTFHISSDTVPNAYATLGGHIFVNKGLIQLLESSEELMGVVAHEMIHVQRRHVMRSVFQGLGMFVIFQGLLGDVSGLVAVAIDQGGPLLNLQYSRRLEEEADRLAIEFLIQNRIRPTGLATALNRINAETKKMVQQSPAPEVLEKLNKIELLSSHPEFEKRIGQIIAISNELSKDVEYREMEFDYSGFKREVKDKF